MSLDKPKPEEAFSFFYRNGLTIFALGFFLLFWLAQTLTGWHDYNDDLAEHGAAAVSLGAYLTTGHFVEATFENWESEFLQMFLYVLVTVKLRQLGSTESKKLSGKEDVDEIPTPSPDSPWPVRKGGWALAVYKNSLSLVFLLLFIFSFVFHAWGSYDEYAVEQKLKGGAVEPLSDYVMGAKFWFESFQNWQSEFLSIAAIVFLSIYLRQFGSPESKPVGMPNNENP